MKVNKTEFIRRLAKKHRRSQAHYSQALEDVFGGIEEYLAAGHTLQFLGFGSFVTHAKKEQQLKFKSIRSGKLLQIKVPAHHYVVFHVGKLLRKAVFKHTLKKSPRGRK